jgi:threonine dehydrogenase-like Zn-dependent dehydrogenase
MSHGSAPGARREKEVGATTMRSAVVAAPGVVEVVACDRPVPRENQVLVKVEGCGVCASNLDLWSGQPWFDYPMPPGVPGHEGWGIVEALGSGTSKYAVGERVAFLSDRSFAEYVVVDIESVMHIPDSLMYQDVPAEPIGCAMNIFRRSGILPGQVVAIVGVGFLGALLTELATGVGADVIAITRRPYALQVAREYGAKHLIEMTDRWAVVEQVKNLTNGDGCDVVIEATGKQEPLDIASDLVKERGRLVIAGYHQDGTRQVNMQSWNWRGIDVINAHERDPKVYLEGMKLAVDAAATGLIRPAPLFTHVYSLDELDRAFEITKTRPDGFMKAIVKL